MPIVESQEFSDKSAIEVFTSYEIKTQELLDISMGNIQTVQTANSYKSMEKDRFMNFFNDNKQTEVQEVAPQKTVDLVNQTSIRPPQEQHFDPIDNFDYFEPKTIAKEKPTSFCLKLRSKNEHEHPKKMPLNEESFI